MAIEHLRLSEKFSKTVDELEKKETVLEEKRRNLSSKDIYVHKMLLLKPYYLTAKQIVLNIFEDKVPRTSRQLFSEFNVISGRQLVYRSFICRLSDLKKQDVICSQKFTMYRSEHRCIYGLPDWFENGELKKEFLDKFEYK